ncbi:o-succinylbenzoate--CoA ligase [Kribbella sp. NPDC048915]|uniref:o-succinylbenzoate--CoA ligase n=1 Tax=Kribbella sp. NPDC048915 TaxID=3155148 RepID=UPI00340AE545
MTRLRLVPGTPDGVLAALAEVLDGSGTPFAPVPEDAAEAARVHQAAQPDAPLEDGAAVVLTTSGSSGEPKGVLLSRDALIASAEATHDRLGGPGQWLLPMKPYFVGGLQILTRSLVAGTTPVIANGSFTEAARQLTGVRRYTAMVPTQLARYLDTDPDALREFDAIIIGGASTPQSLKDRAQEAGVHAIPAYGMTETGSGCVYAGVPLDGTTVDLDEGRIMIKGSTLFSGYRLRPDLTAEVLRDGWFRTQDRGEFVDGRLRVIGRVDDVVISGGVNVTLTTVQARLLEHPDVRDAVVLGAPDDEWGTKVVAFVVANADREPGREELRDFVSETLPRAWAPQEVTSLPELPMLASGKVDRQRLLEGVR